MGWGKFDDAYPHHPKLLQVGPEGLALDVAAVCYANRYGTDGWIPEAMLAGLYPPIRKPAKVAERLAAVGRWERAEGGWWIHDFSDYNPTAAEAAEKREKRARAGRKGGLRSKPPPSKPEANAEASASTVASNGDSPRDEANGNPGPVPPPQDRLPTGGEPVLLPDGDPALNGDVREKFTARLAAELASQHGVELEPQDTAHEAFVALLDTALNKLPPDRHRDTAMGVICDYVEFAQGSLSREARSHTARLVRTHDPATVLHAYGQAMDWGAGLRPEHAADPLSLSKYVAGVLAGNRGGK